MQDSAGGENNNNTRDQAPNEQAEVSLNSDNHGANQSPRLSSNSESRSPPDLSFGLGASPEDRLKYPSRDGTYLSQLYNQPLVTTLTSFSQVANFVRNPYELINNFDDFVRQASGTSGGHAAGKKRRAPRTSENFARTLNQNRHSLTPVRTPTQQEMDTFVAHDGGSTSINNESAYAIGGGHDDDVSRRSPIPTLPTIDATTKKGRLSPLTIEMYENEYRQSSTDLELIERVFSGSMSCNQLRVALWPYLFGLVKHRGRFDLVSEPTSGQQAYIFVEHEANNPRWRELNNLFEVYQSQWKAILPDQETRFLMFRERKSLIEKDVVRCDRLHPFYADEPQNLDKLTQLLMTYVMYDFDIGYGQGMTDIAGPILYMYNGDLVKSFWVFTEVMKLFRRNFEYSQKTTQFQLACLTELVKITDPVFAQYLEENESLNCIFTFRAILCQFKRELMKQDEDDYSKVLFLWDTIWCVERRCVLQEEMKRLTEDVIMSDGGESTKDQVIEPSATAQTNGDTAFAVDPKQADSQRNKLTETEIFVLALCLSLIRRERDIILAGRMDNTDILLHFIDPKLANDMNGFIEHATNIYSFLKNDFDLTKLTSPLRQQTTPTANVSGSDEQASNSIDENADASPTSANDYDSLSDFLIITGASGS